MTSEHGRRMDINGRISFTWHHYVFAAAVSMDAAWRLAGIVWELT